jgi:trans-aconitate 2-methyltransferase
MWNPDQYHRFQQERSRPFFDLVNQVDAAAPRTVADLGCGSGELTATLRDRWPDATIWGVDSSAAMLVQAAAHAAPGRLTFVEADLAVWMPPAPLDVIVANASLQWVDDHPRLIGLLVERLAPQGWLAFQVPIGNHAHTILRELRSQPRWVAQIGPDRVQSSDRALTAAAYIDLLIALGCTVNAWETTYMQLLQGENAVMVWTKGTCVRPILAALSEAEQAEFLAEYSRRLLEAYPPAGYGTLFPFPRRFVVAQRRR